jgi:hypothetical protein
MVIDPIFNQFLQGVSATLTRCAYQSSFWRKLRYGSFSDGCLCLVCDASLIDWFGRSGPSSLIARLSVSLSISIVISLSEVVE